MPRRVQDIIPANRKTAVEPPAKGKIPSRESIKAPARIKKEAIKEVVTEKSVDVEEEEAEESVPIKRPKAPAGAVDDFFAKEKEVASEFAQIKPETVARPMPVTPSLMATGIEKPKRRLRIKIGRWPIVTIVVLVAIVIIGYFASAHYSQATFTIVPKVIPVTVNSAYVAQSSPQGSGLYYNVITLSGSATTTVVATNGASTNTKSTGKATFYNASSTSPVRLIAGTRLSNDGGLIYRLTSSIVIPGYTKSAGAIVPGKLIASIVADQPGQNYNIPKSDQPSTLKIVAYKGSPKYDTIYAKPVAGVTGGYSGTKKIVSPATIASSTAALSSEITASLLNTLKSSIPAKDIMYDKSYVVTFGAPVIGGGATSSASMSLQGTLYAITFPKEKLVQTLAGVQTIALFGNFSYTTPGLDSLQVTITNLKDFSPQKKGALVVRASGNIKVIGTVPVDEIKKKLAGMTLASTQDLFKSYSPVIESGSGELAPPWAKIPSDLSRVKVTVQNP